jgi:hypothetical protein
MLRREHSREIVIEAGTLIIGAAEPGDCSLAQEYDKIVPGRRWRQWRRRSGRGTARGQRYRSGNPTSQKEWSDQSDRLRDALPAIIPAVIASAPGRPAVEGAARRIVTWRATTEAADDSATTANRGWSLAAWGHIVDNDGDAKNTRATINGGPPRIA